MTPEISSCTDFTYLVVVEFDYIIQISCSELRQEKRKKVNASLYRLTQCLHCQVIAKKQKDLKPTLDTTWPQLYGTGDQQSRVFMSTVASGSDVPMCIYFRYEISSY